MKHERKTNTAYVKTLDLELSGNQVGFYFKIKYSNPNTENKGCTYHAFAIF